MTSTRHPTPPADRLDRLLRFVAADPTNDRLRADIFATALAAGVFDEAQRQVVWALTRDPVSFAWRHRLVLLDMARGEWDEADALLRGLKDEGQASPAIDYNLAYVDYARGRLEQAEPRLRQLVETEFDAVPQSLTVLMSCQHLRGAPHEAVATFRRIASRVDAAASFGAASLAAVDAEDRGAALEWADQALQRDGRQPEALVAKATLMLVDGKLRAAIDLLALALARSPNDGRALSAAALAELLDGRVTTARALFARSTAVASGHAETWFGLGWCDFLSNDLAAAQVSFERALALDPARADIHGALAAVHAMQGRLAEAEAAIRHAREIDPDAASGELAEAILSGEAAPLERILARVQAALGRLSTPDGRTLVRLVADPRNDP